MTCNSCARPLQGSQLGSGYFRQPGTTTIILDKEGNPEVIGRGQPPTGVPQIAIPGLGLVTNEIVSTLGMTTDEIIGPLGETKYWIDGRYVDGSPEDRYPKGLIVFYSLLSLVSAGLSTYHGYRRHDSVGAAIGWGLLGGLFPVITPAVAFAQGFGQRKRK